MRTLLRLRRPARAGQRPGADDRREKRSRRADRHAAARDRRPRATRNRRGLSVERSRVVASRPTRDHRRLGRRAPQCGRSARRADGIHEGLGIGYRGTARERHSESDRPARGVAITRSRLSRRRAGDRLAERRGHRPADSVVPARRWLGRCSSTTAAGRDCARSSWAPGGAEGRARRRRYAGRAGRRQSERAHRRRHARRARGRPEMASTAPPSDATSPRPFRSASRAARTPGRG